MAAELPKERTTLRITKPLKEKLEALHAYISVDNPKAAAEQAQAIVLVIDQILRNYPASGCSGLRPDTRTYPVPKTPFIVEHRVVKDVLKILRIFHHAQRWRS